MFAHTINTLTISSYITIFSVIALTQAIKNRNSVIKSVNRFKPVSSHTETWDYHQNLFNQKKYNVRRLNAFDAGLIALGAALNVSIGYFVSLLKLPLYLDSIGTILISVLCGWIYGVLAGLSALIVLSLTVTPTFIAYAGTAVVIAIVSAVLARAGFLRSTRVTIVGGITIGIAAAAASVPVTTLLYGGVSLAGSDFITTIFKAAGMPLWKSVLLGSLITDIIDKFIIAVICLALVRSMPPRMLLRFTRNKNLLNTDKKG